MQDLDQQVETPVDDEVISQPSESISLRDEIEQASKSIRERDESGRFRAKESAQASKEPVRDEVSKDAPTQNPAPAADTKAQEQAKPEKAEQPEMPPSNRPNLAPNSWSAQAKAKWAELPTDIQAEIARRESDVHREFTRQDGERQIGKVMKSVIDPYMPMITQQGGNPVQVVRNMLETARVLQSGDVTAKTQAIRQLIQDVGIDPQALFQEQQYVDPTIQHLQQRVQPFEERERQQQFQAQQQQDAHLHGVIQAFAADPKNVYFEHVREHMSALLDRGQARDLQDAYDQAVWARPDIRSNLLAEQQKAAEDKRLADMKAKADAARRAGSSVSGSPGIGASADPKAANRSLRDELAASIAAHRL